MRTGCFERWDAQEVRNRARMKHYGAPDSLIGKGDREPPCLADLSEGIERDAPGDGRLGREVQAQVALTG